MPRRGAVWVIALAVLATFFFVVTPGRVSAYAPHDPILIEGNANFTAQNGVTGGSGTPSDPYVIEGWAISSHSAFNGSASGIAIRNASAYYVIRSVYMYDNFVGVDLENASHGQVANSTMWDNFYGVTSWDLTDVAITGNSIATDFPTVVGSGIHTFQSTDVRIAQNHIVLNGDGVYVQNSDRIAIASNRIEGDSDRSEGVRLWVSTNVTIGCNDVARNSINVRVFEWNTGIVVVHNNILDAAYVQAQDGEANVWDDGYPGGGNYWSDYTGVDRFSGPNQDQPGSDGIGDTPYVIDNDSADHYPLMNPYACAPPVNPPVTGFRIGAPQYANVTMYVAPMTLLSLAATDLSGTGIRSTTYRIDGGPWEEYAATGPFAIAAEGRHAVEWFSTDNAGNVEAAKSQSLVVDGTPPATTLAPSGTTFSADTAFRLAATDAGSGVARTEYRVDGGPWATYAAPFSLSAGRHEVQYRSTDRLANVEPTRSVTLEVATPPPAGPSGPTSGLAPLPSLVGPAVLAVILLAALLAWVLHRRKKNAR